MAKAKMQTKEKNNETRRRRSERRNSLRKCFHLFKYEMKMFAFFFTNFFTNLLEVIKGTLIQI